ncbi:MAG: DUF2089 domain-containing protein [Anaerolineae bacterium]|nr:DUF2089 domain-containing protein [Anaerolineae bacterium]
MEHALLSKCPVCEGNLLVTGLKCRDCGTVVGGSFSPGLFSRLDGSQAEFLRQFVFSRGNLREMSRRLGVSYPTVRARLNDLVAAVELESELRNR